MRTQDFIVFFYISSVTLYIGGNFIYGWLCCLNNYIN